MSAELQYTKIINISQIMFENNLNIVTSTSNRSGKSFVSFLYLKSVYCLTKKLIGGQLGVGLVR